MILKGGRKASQWLGDRRLVESSPLFDDAFYRQLAKIDGSTRAADHYLSKGWRAGLDPSPFFDTRFYIGRYSDVEAAGINPLIHYLRHGYKERRLPAEGFDAERFFAHHRELPPDSDLAGACLALYASYDWTMLPRAASAVSHGDLQTAAHHVDPAFYLSTNADLDPALVDPVRHYLETGHLEDRDPSPHFDTDFYRRRWLGGTSRINPLLHYRRFGRWLGLRTVDEEHLLLDAATISRSTLSICVHFHCFYPALLDEFVALIGHLPRRAHIVVTTVTGEAAQRARALLDGLPTGPSFEVRQVDNRGRDLVPFLIDCADVWRRYDLVLHLHTKRSLHITWGEAWRLYLFKMLLGSRRGVEAALLAFERDAHLAMLYPANYYAIKRHTLEENNHAALGVFERRLEYRGQPGRAASYAAGSMAWFRSSALERLRDMIEDEDIDREEGSTDGTLAHALERLLPISVRAQGLKVRHFRFRRERKQGTRKEGALFRPKERWQRDSPYIAIVPPVAIDPISKTYDPADLDIHWIVPSFGGPGAGGHMTIFRMVHFLERMGHRQTIWLQNAEAYRTGPNAKRLICEWYQPIGERVEVRFLPDDIRALAGDVLIATDCWTAFPASLATNFKERFYFIQDNEADFHPAGADRLLAEATYRFGFAILCAGEWLLAQAKQRGDWARAWHLAADDPAYFPPTHVSPAQESGTHGPLTIAFYARKHTPRRAVELGLAALDLLHRRGRDIEVHLFGEEQLKLDVNFPAHRHGVVSPTELGELYRRCDIGLVFSATNYSLIPLEMMACGLPVVELDGPSTRAVFRNDEVRFAKATPFGIADAIEHLQAEPEARASQIEGAFGFLEGLSWKKSARTVGAAIVERLAEMPGYSIMDRTRIASPALLTPSTVTVFIPTYNAGPAFQRVLDAVLGQKTDFSVEILVIDSGSYDATIETVRSYADRGARLVQIPNDQFQHGRTRNLGIELASGQHIALLTQDSCPVSSDWLERLIGGFSLGTHVAGVIGRHVAYPEHGPFLERDMREHFDALARLPQVIDDRVSLHPPLDHYSDAQRMMTCFYSDNNSAMARWAWKIMPYPEIEWGEDQVWCAESLRLGLAKAYVDEAAVHHSHPYDYDARLRTARIEGAFWARHFGIRLHANPVEALLGMQARDRAFAVKAKLPRALLTARLAFNEATIKGRHEGWCSEAAALGLDCDLF